MMFQALDDKRRNFLELLDNNLNIIELTYSKGRSWLKHFDHSNLLCARAIRAIVNHTSIDKYYLRFFPQEDFMCPCDIYLIETRRHILYEYKKYNNYWNLRRNILAHFTLFMKFLFSLFLFFFIL